MEIIEIYKNYGCLAAEKRTIFTYGAPQPTAVCSDIIKVKIPEGFKLAENTMGQVIIESPWGWNYLPNEILGGDKHPCFRGIDKSEKEFRIRLEEVKED